MKTFELKLRNDGATLTVYLPDASREMPRMAIKPAILVIPGGGYHMCSDREAEPIALAYASKGFAAFVLRYSVGEGKCFEMPLADVNEAMEIIHANAEEWGVNKEKIASIGFSAGGHLCAALATMGNIRPNASILVYPCILESISDILAFPVPSLDEKVDENTPATFITASREDTCVPIKHSLAYATALVVANNSGLAPIFTQVLESRNGRHYDVEDFRVYDNDGIGGVVCDESVLVGSMSFMRDMGVDVPEGLKVHQAICVSVDGELCGLFAPSYESARVSAMGITALCSNRGLNPIVVEEDFMLTESFIRGKFGVRSRRVVFPEPEIRQELRAIEADEEAPALALMTRQGLAPMAYAVTGARTLRTACVWGVAIHLAAGVLGVAMMLVLTWFGSLHLLTPANMFLYELLWLVPGLLITEWTRSV